MISLAAFVMVRDTASGLSGSGLVERLRITSAGGNMVLELIIQNIDYNRMLDLVMQN